MDRSIFPSRSLFDIWLFFFFFFFRETVRSFLLLDSYDKRAMEKNTNTPGIFPWMYPDVSYFPLWKSNPLDFHTVFFKLLCDIKIPPTNFNQSLLVWESDGNQGVISRPKGFLPLDLELELSRFRPLDGVLSCRKVFWTWMCQTPRCEKTSDSGDFLKWCPFVYPCITKCLIWAEIEQTHQARFKTSRQFYWSDQALKLTGQTVLTLHSSVQASTVPPSRQSCQLHAWGATVELKFSTVLAFWWDRICINKVVFLRFLGITFVFLWWVGLLKKYRWWVSTA